MTKQLLLPLEKNNLLNFASFYSDANPMAIQTLKNWPGNAQMIYLQGPTGSGKTHLAEALTENALQQGQRVLFVSGHSAPAPHFFYDLPDLDLLVIDDIDVLLNFSQQYEEALFTLYNHIIDHPTTKLLVTASNSIKKLSLRLKDLHSRLQSMLLLKLHAPSAEDLEAILTLQANRLQIVLNPEMQTLLIQQRHDHPVKVMTAFVEQSAREKKKPSISYLKYFLSIFKFSDTITKTNSKDTYV